MKLFAAYASSEDDVLGHGSDASGVYGAEVGVLEESDEVCLGGLLESEDGAGLESDVVAADVAGDMADEALEGEFGDEEVGGSLVAADFAESDGAGAISRGFFAGRALAGSRLDGSIFLPAGLSGAKAGGGGGGARARDDTDRAVRSSGDSFAGGLLGGRPVEEERPDDGGLGERPDDGGFPCSLFRANHVACRLKLFDMK